MNDVVEVVDQVVDRSWNELAEREERIQRAWRSAYIETGIELRHIRDQRLYRAARPQAIAGRSSFTSWAEYCASRWDFDDRRARALIEAASVAERIGEFSPVLPAREAHARALLRLASDADRAACWQALVDEHGTSITAKVIEAAVDERLAAQAPVDHAPVVEPDDALPVDPVPPAPAPEAVAESALIPANSLTAAVPSIEVPAPSPAPAASPADVAAVAMWCSLCDLERAGCFRSTPSRLFQRLDAEQQADVRRIAVELGWWTAAVCDL
ncbi:MAG: hypothetical protein AB7P21_07120 [Lautropia sp.]